MQTTHLQQPDQLLNLNEQHTKHNTSVSRESQTLNAKYTLQYSFDKVEVTMNNVKYIMSKLNNECPKYSRGKIGLVDRMFMISHPSFHKKNLELIIKILLENDNPLNFIFKTISNRFRHLITNSNKTQNDQKISHLNKIGNSWFVIPYFGSYSEKFREVVGVSDMRVAYYGVKLRNNIKAHKDPLLNLYKKNVVYKLNCNNCKAIYVGQTKRQLKTRIVEHRNHIKRNKSTYSVITDHRIIFDHEFDWDNVEILDVERNLNKRLISEMINIKSQTKELEICKQTRIPLTKLTFRAFRALQSFPLFI